MDPKLQAAINEAGAHLQDATESLQNLARTSFAVVAKEALELVQEALQELQKVTAEDEAGTQASD